MESDDKCLIWVIGIMCAFFLFLLTFDATFKALEREHDIQQQRLEIKQRQMALQHGELRAQIRLHCLERTDISGDAKSKECWDEL
ncbi:hypothetical protein SBP1_gp009 [Vibrio virus vB_VspP_SBP1]|uniref:Uncharacterized protein n=1 Tax=Vibrio virus vB_VspP_SBP1 TaxID=2500581 RepID=A0A3T0IIG5_9CAUD|nr:hypothetical protein KNU36_gp009 [Vibrio virus vB_VspP_SBP1]AZU99601.1 hypothetical protein SBP1_gp009 [Vibrio virus vB_VspP_SBP1]